MLHVIVTGPESAGKSALARELAARLGGLVVPEYARGYLEAAGRRAVLADFDHFAAAVPRLLARARAQAPPLIAQDTGFEVLRVWAEDKFDRIPRSVREGWSAQAPDAYVLCHPDLPWEYDPLREDPHRRDELLRRYRALLAQSGRPVLEARGRGRERVGEIVRAVEQLRGGRVDYEEE